MLPAIPGRIARAATLALRFGDIALCRPHSAARHLPDSVTLRVVDVIETDPPAGAAPLHWRLLTTHPVSSLAEAEQIVAWYRQRWTVEQVFRTLKSAALAVEQSQIEEARRFTKMAVVGLIAAVRIVQITQARDGRTGQAMTDAIDAAQAMALRAINATLQGRTEKLCNPHAPESLAWLAWIVARLGGWSGYTSRGYRPPGPKTIARGLARLDGLLDGWNLAIHSADVRLP
jgi:Transposase DDE domain